MFATCAEAGLDPAREPVPVAPAAHYLVGGIASDLDGRTTLPGLLAVGECSCTGLHGANRLASNSLTECFVFGTQGRPRRARRARAGRPPRRPASGASSRRSRRRREAVWRLAGPRRTAPKLERLLDDPYPLARMIAASALERRESRGAHRRRDFPLPDPALDGIHVSSTRSGTLRAERWS